MLYQELYLCNNTDSPLSWEQEENEIAKTNVEKRKNGMRKHYSFKSPRGQLFE